MMYFWHCLGIQLFKFIILIIRGIHLQVLHYHDSYHRKVANECKPNTVGSQISILFE